LIYMYYNFENKPWWFRAIWRCSDLIRRCICKLPHPIKRFVTDLIAVFAYWPLAKLSELLEKLGLNVNNIPLSAYRKGAFITCGIVLWIVLGPVWKNVIRRQILSK